MIPGITLKCRRIVSGYGEGRSVITDNPINFLTMVDSRTGVITDPRHELYGRSLKENVLIIPHSVGSSVGAYVLYALRQSEAAPSAVICLKADIITASGCAIAHIPLVDLIHQYSEMPSDLTLAAPQASIKVDAERERIIIGSDKKSRKV